MSPGGRCPKRGSVSRGSECPASSCSETGFAPSTRSTLAQAWRVRSDHGHGLSDPVERELRADLDGGILARGCAPVRRPGSGRERARPAPVRDGGVSGHPLGYLERPP
jgi:hypothetical protein